MSTGTVLESKYVETAPVRDHLLEIKPDGVAWHRVAIAAGVYHGCVTGLRDNKFRHMRRDIAEKILALEPLDLALPSPDEEVVRRILAGLPFTIPHGEAQIYARHLHEQYGWSAARLSRTLRISGQHARKAIS